MPSLAESTSVSQAPAQQPLALAARQAARHRRRGRPGRPTASKRPEHFHSKSPRLFTFVRARRALSGPFWDRNTKNVGPLKLRLCGDIITKIAGSSGGTQKDVECIRLRRHWLDYRHRSDSDNVPVLTHRRDTTQKFRGYSV